MSKERNPKELADLLDELFNSSDDLPLDAVEDPMAQVAMQLSESPRPQISDEARARILERVKQAHQATPPIEKPEPAPTSRLIQFPAQVMLRWVAVFAVFVLLLNNVAVPAMADSLPGDVLYPVKITLETIELNLAGSEAERASVYLTQAERRIEETLRLLDDNRWDSNTVSQAIDHVGRARDIITTNSVEHLQNRADTAVMRLDDVLHKVEDDPSTEHLISQLSAIAPTPETTPELDTQIVVVEATEEATPTNTPEPTETDTPEPTETDTPEPTETDTPEPTETDTPEPTETDTPAPTETLEPSDTTVLEYESYVAVISGKANVNVRKEPSLQSDVIRLVTPGTLVTVIGETIDGEWIKIDIHGETVGWVADFLIVEGTVPLVTIETPVSEVTTSTSDTAGQSSDTVTDNNPGGNSNNNDCEGRGASCYAPGQSDNLPPGQGGVPPGQANNGNNGNNGNGNGNSGNNGNNGKKNQ